MKQVVVTLVVQTKPGREFRFEAAPRRKLGHEDMRRLWDAERAFNELVGLTVTVTIGKGGADGGQT